MPKGRRSTGAAKRNVPGVPNNAPGLVLYTGNWHGDPYNNNVPVPTAMTDAKLVEWDTQRMIAGGGFGNTATQMEYMFGEDRYTTDGSLPLTPETSWRAWFQQALKLLWGSSNKNWFVRTAELGLDSYIILSAASNPPFSSTHAFNTTWENNTTWGASTVAGALTPGAGSVLEDFIRICKSGKAAGYKGVWWDLEMSDQTGFNINYVGRPGGYLDQQIRDLVKLRGQQLEMIFRTHWVGGEFILYNDRSTGSWDELRFYQQQNGAVPTNVFASITSDYFAAGLASGTTKYTHSDATFYKDVGLGQDPGADDGVTAWANAYSYNSGNRYARLSQICTDAERLAAMRNTNHAGFLWLTSGAVGEGQPAVSVALGTRMIREAVRWSNGGKYFIYTQNHDDNPAFNGSNFDVMKDHGPYEAAFQTYNVASVAQTTRPTVSITHIDGVSNPGATTYSTSASSVTVQLTATDDFAIWRGEWANAANALTGCCVSTWVNDAGANWNPLNASLLPQNSALGRIPCHTTLLATIPVVAGTNTVTFPVYNIHGLATTVTLTVTGAGEFSYDFASSIAGWTQFAGTVTATGGKMRTATAAQAGTFPSAGAYHNAACPQDYEWSGNATLTTVTASQFYGAINVRATANTFNDITQNGGWRVLFVGGTGDGHAELYRVTPAGALTWLVSGPNVGFTQGSVLRVRINVEGTFCKVRYWKDAETEPTTWGIDFDDPSAPTGTGMSVGNRSGGDAAADVWDWDDITVNSGTAPVDPPPTPIPSSLQELFYSLYPTAANEIWVDGALGNDAAAGTAVAPKATIQGAINASTAGSRIMVRPYASGYATHNFAGHSGTATNYIQMVAPSGAIINANGGTATGSSATSMVGNANFIAVYGFEYVGINLVTSQYETGVVVANGAHDVAVWGCYFHDLASHAVCLPGNANQGWAGSDKIDFCYNRVTRCANWNENQASGFSTIDMVPIGSAWADGYRNHIVGNVIDACWTDPSRDPPWDPGGPLSDGNCIILDHSAGYTGTDRTLVAHNLTVGAGGRGIHVLGHPRADVWLNTSCDNVQNLTGTWDAELSLFTSTGSNCQYNVAAAKVGRNRVGLLTSGSAWNNNVFVRGTGGSEANDPGVASNNNVNKTSIGPAGYFQAYQQGVYQSTVITNIAGFRPVAAQAATFAPPTNIRNAVSPWPDALGFTRPATGVWAHGAFEATAVPPASSSGVHWGASITQDSTINFTASINATAKAAYSSVQRAAYNSHITGFSTYPPMTAPGVYDWGGEGQGQASLGLDDSIGHIRQMVHPTNGVKMITLCSAPGFMKPSGNPFAMTEVVTDAMEDDFANLFGDILNRYTDFDWFQFWNEMKGMDNLAAADRLKYTRMYNLAWAKKQAVRPTAKLGGPYVVWDSWQTGFGGNPSSTLGAQPCTFNGGAIDNRVLDMHIYWRDNAVGWDFICLDAYIGNRHAPAPYTITPGKTHAQQADKFVQMVNWIRTYVEPTKPIVFSEWYPVDGTVGLSTAQAEDQVITCFTLIRDNCDVRDGIHCIQWLEQDEPPNPVNYSTGAATGLIQKLINWEASQ